MLYAYYCTVKIGGTIVVKDNTLYWVNVNYTILSIDDECNGLMKFSEPVNMTYLKQNMYSMFNIYWRDINHKNNQLNHKLLDFEVTDWGTQDNMTLAFKLTFDQPYMLGLLKKRSDRLFIDKNTTFNITNRYFFFNTTKYGNASDNNIYGNQSLHTLYTNSSAMRIEM